MIQSRPDAQIRYTPQEARKLAAWAVDGVESASRLETEDKRRAAFTALLAQAPYTHIQRLVFAAAVEILILRGL